MPPGKHWRWPVPQRNFQLLPHCSTRDSQEVHSHSKSEKPPSSFSWNLGGSQGFGRMFNKWCRWGQSGPKPIKGREGVKYAATIFNGLSGNSRVWQWPPDAADVKLAQRTYLCTYGQKSLYFHLQSGCSCGGKHDLRTLEPDPTEDATFFRKQTSTCPLRKWPGFSFPPWTSKALQ
jgi:hypothetical protein